MSTWWGKKSELLLGLLRHHPVGVWGAYYAAQPGSLSSLLSLRRGGPGWAPFFLWRQAVVERSWCKHLVSSGCHFPGPLAAENNHSWRPFVCSYCASGFPTSVAPRLGCEAKPNLEKWPPRRPRAPVPPPLPVAGSCVCPRHNILVCQPRRAGEGGRGTPVPALPQRKRSLWFLAQRYQDPLADLTFCLLTASA